MGTNFYRIPTQEEVTLKRDKLVWEIQQMDISPSSIESQFRVAIDDQWNGENPWETFINNTSIHLGKRSMGWKFCWNFHDNKYYSNKEELVAYIRSGRVVDEYGDEQEVEEFITMALEWGQPDGHVLNAEYEKLKSVGHIWGPKYYDLIIDGLRVSSSTDFC